MRYFIRLARSEHFNQYSPIPCWVATWLYSLLIQKYLKLFQPLPSMTTVTVYSKYSSPKMIQVEIGNIPECDIAIFKIPITSVLLSRSKISNCNWRRWLASIIFLVSLVKSYLLLFEYCSSVFLFVSSHTWQSLALLTCFWSLLLLYSIDPCYI